LAHTTIAEGGVLPNINSSILPGKTSEGDASQGVWLIWIIYFSYLFLMISICIGGGIIMTVVMLHDWRHK
jgi:hypothetical protein